MKEELQHERMAVAGVVNEEEGLGVPSGMDGLSTASRCWLVRWPVPRHLLLQYVTSNEPATCRSSAEVVSQ